MNPDTHIHPEFCRQVPRIEKEQLLGQRGLVVWLYGLSGSGKSTIANALERQLHESGRLVAMLDGDNLRSGLNRNLGFTDEDRCENIRRVAEVAKTIVRTGAVVLVSVITPREAFRQSARKIIGGDDFLEVYVKASFETCRQRDVKGLYEKADAGQIANFTGQASAFEEPEAADLVLDTERASLEECLSTLICIVQSRISLH
jgi:adenylylsulfate kinase